MVEFNHLPAVIAAIHEAASQSVRKAAFDVQAKAQSLAAVDTGFMKSAIYTVTHDTSNYGSGAKSPPPGAELLPEVEKPRDDHTAYVVAGASYSIHVNYGTAHSPAQPFMEPAADAVRPAFVAAMSKLEEALARVVR